jgi:hypothetical protein
MRLVIVVATTLFLLLLCCLASATPRPGHAPSRPPHGCLVVITPNTVCAVMLHLLCSISNATPEFAHYFEFAFEVPYVNGEAFHLGQQDVDDPT